MENDQLEVCKRYKGCLSTFESVNILLFILLKVGSFQMAQLVLF